MVDPSRPFAVVTGASTGIGHELARLFLENGFDVLITADEPEVAEAARSLQGSGGSVHSVQADLATREGVERLYAAVTATARPVDAVALNAGVASYGAFATETDLEAELRLVQLNVTSVVHLAKLVLPGMVGRGEGRVLITSSIAAKMPGPLYATYAASKSFLLSFAEAIRHELKDSGVTVTALMPGPTDTEFFDRAGMAETKVGASDHKDDPAEVARDGFEAMMAGKDHVVAGSVMNKAQAAGTRLMPETAKAATQAQMLKPDSSQE